MPELLHPGKAELGRVLAAAAVAVLATALLPAGPDLVSAWAMEVRHFKRDGHRGSLVADFPVAADPDRVFGILIDDERFSEFMPYIVESRALEKNADRATVRMRVRRFGFFDFTVTYERRYLVKERRVTWHEVGGFFKRDDGSWTVTPDGPGSRVTYQIVLDPGFPVPAFLLRFALTQGLDEIERAIQKRVEILTRV